MDGFEEEVNLRVDVDELLLDVAEVQRMLQNNNVENVIDVNEIYEKLEELTYINRKERIEYVATQLLLKLGIVYNESNAMPKKDMFTFAIQHDHGIYNNDNLSFPNNTLPAAFKENHKTNVLPSEELQNKSNSGNLCYDGAYSNAFYNNRDVLMKEAQDIYSIVCHSDVQTIYRCLESHKDNSSRVQIVTNIFLKRNNNCDIPKHSSVTSETVYTPKYPEMSKEVYAFAENTENNELCKSNYVHIDENVRKLNIIPVRSSCNNLFHNDTSIKDDFNKNMNPLINSYPFKNGGCIKIDEKRPEMDVNGKENEVFENVLKQPFNEINISACASGISHEAMLTHNPKNESSINTVITEEAKFISGIFPNFEHDQILEYLDINRDVENRVEVICEELMKMQEDMISEAIEMGLHLPDTKQIDDGSEVNKGGEEQEVVKAIGVKEEDSDLIDLDCIVLKEQDDVNTQVPLDTDGGVILLKENCESTSLLDNDNLMVSFEDDLPDEVTVDDESINFDETTTNCAVVEEPKMGIIEENENINDAEVNSGEKIVPAVREYFESCAVEEEPKISIIEKNQNINDAEDKSGEEMIPAVSKYSELAQASLEETNLGILNSSEISDIGETEEGSYELHNDPENFLYVSPATSTNLQSDSMELFCSLNEDLYTFGEGSNIKEDYEFTFAKTEKGKHMEGVLIKDTSCNMIMVDEKPQEKEDENPQEKEEDENKHIHNEEDENEEGVLSVGNSELENNITKIATSKAVNVFPPVMSSVTHSVGVSSEVQTTMYQPRTESSNKPPEVEIIDSPTVQQDKIVSSELEPSTSQLDNAAHGSNFSYCVQNISLIESERQNVQTDETEFADPLRIASQGCRRKEITHEEFLSKLPHVDMVFLEETWKRIGNNYFAIKEFIAEQLEEVSSDDNQYLMLMSMFPQADPKFLYQVAKEVGNDETKLKKFIDEQLQEGKSEPRHVTLSAMFPQEDPTFLREKCFEIGNDDVAMRNFVVELIKKNEGFNNYDTLLAMLPESDPAFLQEMVDRIGDDEEAMKKFVSEQLEEVDSVQFRTLLAVLPDADPEYLQDMYNKLGKNEESMKLFLLEALENNDYPTREMYVKRQEKAAIKRKYCEEFNIQEFLEMFPDPWTHFKNIKHKHDEERKHAREYLESQYLRINWAYVEDTYRRSGYNLFKTCDLLDKWIGPWEESRVFFRYAIPSRDDIPVEFLQEAKANGELLECQCCFNNELLDLEVDTCTEGHIFCKECIKKSAEIAISEGRCHFLCLTNCLAEFSLRVIQGLLKPTVFSKMILRRQMEEVQAAGIADLETCPFCDFATIPAANDKVFMCLNPECMRDSCRMAVSDHSDDPETETEMKKSSEEEYVPPEMEEPTISTLNKVLTPLGQSPVTKRKLSRVKSYTERKARAVNESVHEMLNVPTKSDDGEEISSQKCKRPNHIPMNCNEIETKEVKMRTFIEDKMTDALIRCPLFSETEDIHIVAVMEEGIKAKKKVQAENPNIELKHDPTENNLSSGS
ncbi:hypothetical protein C0J52_03662 [Blattella germanica]|nr:hypothetical protein C0J52_03662 [Blattella germanica]